MNPDITYKALQLFLTPFFSVSYHLRTTGKENLIQKPVIFASNHSSYLDPSIIIYALSKKEPIHFIAAQLKGIGGIYEKLYKQTGQMVLKGKGILALKDFYEKSQQTLDKGRCLVIFPEGKRNNPRDIGKFNNGASSIAIRTQTPIIPIYISGAYDHGNKFPRLFRNIDLRFGKPIEPPESKGRKSVSGLTEKLRNEIIILSKS